MCKTGALFPFLVSVCLCRLNHCFLFACIRVLNCTYCVVSSVALLCVINDNDDDNDGGGDNDNVNLEQRE